MPSPYPQYRPATEEDIADIVELVNRAYRDERQRGWTSEADLVSGERVQADAIRPLLDDPASLILLMHHEAGLGGCVHLQHSDGEVLLGMLSIDPVFQNRGLGKALMVRAEQHARREWSACRISMIVVAQRRELIDYYLRRGYSRSGITLPYPVNQGVGDPRVEGLYLEKLSKALKRGR